MAFPRIMSENIYSSSTLPLPTGTYWHGPQDEILPHGTMLELLREGFSGAYDKVMYDRRGVNHNLQSNCGILPSMVFIISTCHENMFWKRENMVWSFYSCSMAIWNSRLLGKIFNLLDGPTVTEECLMPLEADRRAHGQVERSPLPSPFYGLRPVAKTWKWSVYPLSGANGLKMVLVLLLLLL